MTSNRTMNSANAQDFIKKFNIRNASEVAATGGVFIVLYAQGGGGKTTLAADVHKLGATIIADADAGSDAISHLKDKVQVADINRYRDFKDFTNWIKSGNHNYQNVIIDNIVALQEECIEEISGPTDAPEIQEWGAMTREIIFRTKEWRDIARHQGINVIMNAWDEDKKDARGNWKQTIAFTPALQTEFPGVVTIIGHIAVQADPNRRLLSFAPNPKTISKFRRAADAASLKVPYEIYYGLDNLPMSDIIRTIKGEIEWPTAKYPPPERRNNNTNRRSNDAED